MKKPISIEISFSKLGKQFRGNFDCGVDPLNNYLKMSAGQEGKKSVSVTYIMCIGDELIGYYTLSSNSIDLSQLPTEKAKKLPKYPKVPVTLLGRLAVDCRYQGKGYGTLLLAHALKKAATASTEIASYAVIVDAKGISAEKFYISFGFIPYEETRKLFLPMETIIRGIDAKSLKKTSTV
jgi:GNAT superfamily N-acetyltransferase